MKSELQIERRLNQLPTNLSFEKKLAWLFANYDLPALVSWFLWKAGRQQNTINSLPPTKTGSPDRC